MKIEDNRSNVRTFSDLIVGDGEVEVTCCKCGKKKFIRFSSKSLTEFRIGGKKCD